MKGRWFANDDIPTIILSRLSAKKLQILKYVSKDWHNLISDRSFIATQLKNPEPLSGFFFQEVFQFADEKDIDCISYIPVDVENFKVWRSVLNFLPENVVILSLNNGILCCRSCFPTSYPRIYVCNPLNSQFTSFPLPSLPQDSSIALVFDPVRNPVDKSTDFKLVVVSHVEEKEDEYCFFFDIYSSGNEVWTRSKECCSCNHSLSKNKGVLVEGVLYWLTDGYKILMFDPQNELSWLISLPLPATQFSSVPEMCIGESKGKLCYVIISEDGLQLWALEDNFASQWELKVSVSLDELEAENSDVLYGISEKVASRVSEDMMSWMDPLAIKDDVLLLRVSTGVCMYRFDVGKMKKICDVLDLGPKSMFSPIVVPYAMSLVPISLA